jgi:putative ABC transport system ATP-binding protein
VSEILIREGPLSGHRYELDAEIVLGRGDVDLWIDDQELSRRHALLRPAEGTLEVEDLVSLNGTWVNGVRITAPTRLQAGDLVRLGKTVIELLRTSGDTVVQAPSEPVIQAREVTRQYDDGDAAVHALRGVSLDVERGELTAIMGPSGSGKSTLMHILAGLDRPTSGSVSVDGVEITKLNDYELTMHRRERIGFIFQFFNLLPMLTAEENIALPLSITGNSKPDELEELLKRVGLADRRKHRPAELSGGQQQRVAIARALISRPVVVFADEPTGNLDSSTGAEILALLREAVDSFNQTTVMVTHDPRAAKIADRVLFLADGLIASDRDEASTGEVLLALDDVSGG